MAFGDLTTLSDVKAWLSTGGPPGTGGGLGPADDALLTRLITASSGWIQRWLNRSIVSQDWREIRDGPGGPFAPSDTVRVQFGAFPVTAVSLVIANGITVPPVPPVVASGVQTVGFFNSQAGYLFSPTQLAIRGFAVPRRPQCLIIEYTAGYPVVPPEIAQACIELVALRYKERKHIGEVSQHLGDGATVAYSQRDMSADIATLLTQYRAVAPVTSFLTPAQTQTDPAVLAGAA